MTDIRYTLYIRFVKAESIVSFYSYFDEVRREDIPEKTPVRKLLKLSPVVFIFQKDK